jgi:hypothetical protein
MPTYTSTHIIGAIAGLTGAKKQNTRLNHKSRLSTLLYPKCVLLSNVFLTISFWSGFPKTEVLGKPHNAVIFGVLCGGETSHGQKMHKKYKFQKK